jgi:hypothetical protein
VRHRRSSDSALQHRCCHKEETALTRQDLVWKRKVRDAEIAQGIVGVQERLTPLEARVAAVEESLKKSISSSEDQ